jgi:hypothetical protein
VLTDAGEELGRQEVAVASATSGPRIDVGTKVVIPQVVSMAVA